MINKFIDILIIAFVMLILDFIYLNITNSHFNSVVKKIQGKEIQFKYLPAVLAYTLMVLGLYYFIINKKGNYIDGFILGLVIYGVFDMTNAVLFDKWDYKTILLDTSWGAILFALITCIYNNIKKI